MPTPEQTKWIEEMESLMAHPAWATLMDDLTGNAAAIKDSWANHKTIESYHFDRGRAAALAQVIGLESFVKQAKDSFVVAPLPNAEEQYDAEDV